MKLTGRKDHGFNKYKHMIDLSSKFEPEKSSWDMLSTAIFGESEQERSYKASYNKFVGDHAKKASYGKKKLGAEHITSLFETVDGTIWTGEIYMARRAKMDVVFDTGSDWLTVEGI